VSKRVVIVEDEQEIGELISLTLKNDGFTTELVSTGEAGLNQALANPPDLVVLDWMLPGKDGLEVCRLLRSDERTKKVPIIMLTAKVEEADIVSGLEVGADDYITKPFSPRVLLARVHALLRRESPPDKSDHQDHISHQGLEIDTKRRSVSYNGKDINLTNSEFQLLFSLASRPGWVFNREQLVTYIRGEDVFVTDRTVDVHVAGLRKKLGDAAKFIETVRGVGYRFRE